MQKQTTKSYAALILLKQHVHIFRSRISQVNLCLTQRLVCSKKEAGSCNGSLNVKQTHTQTEKAKRGFPFSFSVLAVVVAEGCTVVALCLFGIHHCE